MESLAGHAEVQVRGAGEQRQISVVEHPQAHHPDERIRSALRNSQAGWQAKVLRRRWRQLAHLLPGRHNLLRPLDQKLLQVQRRQQRGGPAAGRVVVPAHRHVVQGRRHAPRQVKVHVVLRLADVGGCVEDVRLILPDPQRLGYHPLGRHWAATCRVDLQRGVARGEHLLGLLRTAHVHPQQRGAQRLPVCPQRHDRAAGGVQAQGCDVINGHARLGNRLLDRAAQRLPPVLRPLLRPARSRVLRRVRRGGKRQWPSCQVEHASAQALRPRVDANHKLAGGRHIADGLRHGGSTQRSDEAVGANESATLRVRPAGSRRRWLIGL
mmetsp:Transcript_44715/g.115722  ORF Transcript_44715/g.115722 Transcript_44715/m.115722 type:complete len:324 (-) Transcript_44715:73-1044(-)